MFVFLINLRNYIINFIRLKRNRISYGDSLVLNGTPIMTGDITIGSNCRINSGMSYNPIGGDGKTMFLTYGGKIKIGNNVGISNTTIVSKALISIGNNVRIGGSCKIYDTDFHSVALAERLDEEDRGVVSKPVIINEGAFIGAHSIILKGVIIGKEAVVGAGSVVTKSIPDKEIWAGNPARFVKQIDKET